MLELDFINLHLSNLHLSYLLLDSYAIFGGLCIIILEYELCHH